LRPGQFYSHIKQLRIKHGIVKKVTSSYSTLTYWWTYVTLFRYDMKVSCKLFQKVFENELTTVSKIVDITDRPYSHEIGKASARR